MAKAKTKVAANPAAAAKAASGKRQRSESKQENTPVDPMSQCVAFCQEQRWREATDLFIQMCDKAAKDGNQAMHDSLSAARLKVEYSLRRQMAASLIHGAKQMLAKEFLLDVGE